MNYFFVFVILGICGGAYYDHTNFRQKNDADQKEIADLSTQLDALKTENKKLTDDKAQLTKNATATQAELADLTQQVQTAQSALAALKEQDLEAAKAAVVAAAAPPPPPRSPNDLGTIATVDGKTYPNCQLLKVQPDGIVINCASGITEIKFVVMPPGLQKRFGYDSQLASALTDDQVRIQEEKRKNATQLSGN